MSLTVWFSESDVDTLTEDSITLWHRIASCILANCSIRYPVYLEFRGRKLSNFDFCQFNKHRPLISTFIELHSKSIYRHLSNHHHHSCQWSSTGFVHYYQFRMYTYGSLVRKMTAQKVDWKKNKKQNDADTTNNRVISTFGV